MKLWLDDMRNPKHFGKDSDWVWVLTIDVAKEYLATGQVEECSLDHDLGACKECMQGMTAEEWLDKHNWESMPHCEHFGTGYDLVCWMEENDIWPKNKPTVHSANPVGRQRMQQVIDKKYG